MKTRKEKAIDLILLGIAIQWIPSAIVGAFSVELDKRSPVFGLLKPFPEMMP